jgi:hypothetical protein
MKNSKNPANEISHMKSGLKKKAEGLKDDSFNNTEEGTSLINEKVERIVGKNPSILITRAAIVSLVISMFFQIRGKRDWALFVAHWAPTLLLFGIFRKLSKTVSAG